MQLQPHIVSKIPIITFHLQKDCYYFASCFLSEKAIDFFHAQWIPFSIHAFFYLFLLILVLLNTGYRKLQSKLHQHIDILGQLLHFLVSTQSNHLCAVEAVCIITVAPTSRGVVDHLLKICLSSPLWYNCFPKRVSQSWSIFMLVENYHIRCLWISHKQALNNV